jgi:hypothetical protein
MRAALTVAVEFREEYKRRLVEHALVHNDETNLTVY